MKVGWQEKQLSQVCVIRPPKSEARKRLNSNASVTFAPMEDLGIDRKYLEASQVKPLSSVSGSYTYFADGDVLLAKITPCFENGKLGIAANLSNGVGFGSSEFIVLRPTEILDSAFLYYYLSRDDFRSEGAALMGGAVGHQRVPKEFVEGHLVPVPPIGEQRRIVSILDEAFDGIATAKANAEKNLQNATAIFSSALEAVFSRSNEDWVDCGKPLADLCDLIVDCEHKTAPTQESGIPSIRTPNIGKGMLLLEGVYRVSEQIYKEWTRRAEPQEGDLILAREAPAGNVAVVPPNTKLCLGQRTVLIRPSRKIFEPSFLAYLLLQPSMQSKLLAHSRGATVQHVNMKDIRALKVGAIPPLGIQRSIVAKINSVVANGKRLESIYQRKLAALGELKQSLLHKAFSGAL